MEGKSISNEMLLPSQHTCERLVIVHKTAVLHFSEYVCRFAVKMLIKYEVI